MLYLYSREEQRMKGGFDEEQVFLAVKQYLWLQE
jgi:hypothetical protein